MNPRVILITGANGGLGQAIAQSFLQENSENILWLAVHRNHSAAEQLLIDHPSRCRITTLDVTQPDAWKKSLADIQAQDARLDVLVNNAGSHFDSLLGSMSPASWSQVISTNLDAAFHGCQAVLPAMISQRSGRIINIASISALLPPPGQSNYAAAKAGLLALTQSLAKEVARIGITVNAVCPGYVETEALASMTPEQKQAAAQRIPMRRFGRPSEVAAAVRFLACPEASYITGSIIKVDGGIL